MFNKKRKYRTEITKKNDRRKTAIMTAFLCGWIIGIIVYTFTLIGFM